MKPAVILFSHGSLLCGAGEQLAVHAQRLRETEKYSCVEIGYLNYSAPTFAEAVEKCADAGAREILIAPYFLVPGYFVQVGLPSVLDPARARFPEIEFSAAPVLGDHPLLADAVIDCANRAATSEHWRAILHSAPLFCEREPTCPLSGRCLDTPLEELSRRTRPSAPLKANSSSLLVMVHGSPKPESNEDMFRVVEMIRAREIYREIAVGFMECNEPDIPTAIAQIVENGASSIVAVPFFLHAGTHVADDLPSVLEAAQEKYLETEFLLGDYLGAQPPITEVLSARLEEIAQPLPVQVSSRE